MSSPGTAYVIEQLGQALQASHAALDRQREQIERLTAERDDLLQRADHAPQDAPPVPMPTWDRNGPTGQTTT